MPVDSIETVGKVYNPGRVVQVKCVRNDPLSGIRIRNKCFLLLILREGSARFAVGERTFEVIAPAFVCFDEREDPLLLRQTDLRCDAIYFHPSFMNRNLSFQLVHSAGDPAFAVMHDMFLLSPFTDGARFDFPIFDSCLDNVDRLFEGMAKELEQQSDWYWSCRARSYFLELILMLERSYGIVERMDASDGARPVENHHLRAALLFIESHYTEEITIDRLTKELALNHSTLTNLFKAELGTTPIDYVWTHRVRVAMRHLKFTNLTLKEVSGRCGFKTVQHFCRKFKDEVGCTPLSYRESTLADRRRLMASREGMYGNPIDGQPTPYDELEEIILSDIADRSPLYGQAIRAQMASRKVLGRTPKRWGYLAELELPADIPLIGEGDDLQLDSSRWRLDGLAQGCRYLLQIKAGRIAWLEGYTYQEEWPRTITVCEKLD